MTVERLEINRISQTGEVLRKISCLAGRITVFRSNIDREYELYRAALAGWETKDRVSLQLDGVTFSARKACMIGFGEAFASEPGDPTVHDFLLQAGVPDDRVETELLDLGLGGLANQRCKMLGPVQERVLRLVAAIYQNPPVIVLYEPFEQVAEQWREVLGQRLSSLVWKKKSIVVVVRLTNRPECWVENEHVARVQLERPRKRTIGFGSDIDPINEMAMQLRAQSTAIDLRSLTKPSSRWGQLLWLFQHSRLFGYSVVIAAAAAFCVGFTWYTNQRLPSNSYSSASPDLGGTTILAGTGNSATSLETGAGRSASANQLTSISGQRRSPATASALDGYPQEIKESVILAFNNPDALLEEQKARAASVSFSGAATNRSSLPPEALQNIHGNFGRSVTHSYQPDAENQFEAPNEQELETRREEIRQKFLEAIQRSQADGADGSASY